MNEVVAIQNKYKVKFDNTIPSNQIEFNHEFFRILNGHPHSVILIASLRNDIGLEAIYKKLMKIKSQLHLTPNDMSEFIFALNVEASLEFIRKQSMEAYKILM